MDCIQLKSFTVKCLMGMSRSERVREQPIEIELSLFFDSHPAAQSGRLEQAIDYVRTLGEVRFILEHGEFLLVESAAEAVCQYLLLSPLPDCPRADLQAVRLRLTKPRCLDGLAVPSLEIFREKKDFNERREPTSFGTRSLLHKNPHCSLRLLQLFPSQSLCVRGSELEKESELVLGDHLEIQNQSVQAGNAFRWHGPNERLYCNRREKPQSILHIGHPGNEVWEKVGPGKPQKTAPFQPIPFYPAVLSEYIEFPE